MNSAIVVVIMVALFVAAVMFISKNGGWAADKGCHGDCAKCHESCDSKPAAKDKE